MSNSLQTGRAAPKPSAFSGQVVVAILIWIALIFAPYWLHYVGGYTDLASRALIYAIAAYGLNLLLGYTGGMSFGHAAYFGLGAYGAGLCLIHIAPSMPLAILCGTLLGGVAGILVGPMAMKRKGIYFAMITIAFAQMFYFISVRWNSLTGGEDGLTGFGRVPLHLGHQTIKMGPIHFYYVVLFFFALVMLIIWQLLRSPMGHSFVAVRENTTRLRFLGVSVEKQIWVAFAISAFIVGLGGSLNALLTGFASPDNLNWQLSGAFVVICVLGGMRSFWGPLLGAVIYIVAQDYLSSITQNWMSFIGLIFVLAVLFFPNGLLGFVKGRARS